VIRPAFIFWAEAGWAVRLLLLLVFCITAVSLGRFAILFRYLCVRQKISDQKVEPRIFARYALSHQAWQERPFTPVRWDLADAELQYLFAWCSIHIESAKRESWLVFLITLLAFACGVSSLDRSFCVGGLTYCLFEEAIHRSYLLIAGLSASAVVYFVSDIFDRTLSYRRASWQFFFAKMKCGSDALATQPTARNPLVD
jgi:hypothetical protein